MENAPTDESELLQLATSDPTALNALFASAREKVRDSAEALMFERLNTRCDSSDAAQIALTRAFANFSSFKGSTVQEFNAWIDKIIKHVVLELIRKHIRSAKRSINSEQRIPTDEQSLSFYCYEFATDEHSPASFLIAQENSKELLDTLAKLSDSHLEVIQLRYFEKMAMKDLAAELEITVVAAAGRLKRALKCLREAMEDRD